MEGSKPRAAIVLFHGGGWNSGQPEWTYSAARRFAALGMVAIAAQYRLADEKAVTPLEAMSDASDAVRWVRANAARLGIDCKRVAAYGVSAGGQLAAAAAMIQLNEEPATRASAGRPNALILYSPAVAIAHSGWVRRLLQGRSSPDAISPDRFIRPGLPPTHITQGDEDVMTPYSGARDFCAEMKRVGNICDVRRYSSLGHLLTRRLDQQEFGFEPDPAARADAWRAEERFLVNLGFAASRQLRPGFDGPEIVVRSMVSAFNAGEAKALAALVAEDLICHATARQPKGVESLGRAAFRDCLWRHYPSSPNVRIDIQTLSTNGSFVAVRERVSWTTVTGATSSEHGHVVYDVHEGQIRQFWGFARSN